jgi:DNA-binding NarL/FixJ family response regulator
MRMRLECAWMFGNHLHRPETIMSIRLVLADDHPLLLEGLELLLRREPDFEVLACCHNGVQALHAVRQLRPDILVLDLSMPDKNGLEILRELHQATIPTRVVLLTAIMNEDDLLEAMRLGVGGVVLKEMTSPLLVQSIRKVFAGDQWLEPISKPTG